MTTADADHAIAQVLDAHEAAYHPGIACPETQEGRCAIARPVESPEDRMAAAPKPGPTFATYLDRHDRNQLDARAACAEAERDEALDARNVLRQQLDQAQQRNRDLANLLRRKKDTISALAAELGDAHDLIAEIRNNRANDDRALARWETRQTGQPPVEPDDTDPDAVQNLLDDATRAFADAGTSSERVEVIRDLLAGWYAAWPSTAVTDEHEGIAHQIVALVHAAEARAGAGLGSVSPHAQDDLTDRLAGALVWLMRLNGGEGVTTATWDSWEALLAEHAKRKG